MNAMRIFGIMTLALAFSACAEGHCRHMGGNAAPQENLPAAEAAPMGATASETRPAGEDHIFVYKYDGSLQCKRGKVIPLEVMAKDLAGIEIFSMKKKNDGMMHIQVCGSITGRANVFEIPANALGLAEKRGFKKWTFE